MTAPGEGASGAPRSDASRLADPVAGHEPHPSSPPGDLAEVARLAFRLGVTAFGGPAAHIAMLRDETVNRRRWFTDAAFLDMVGASNLIPGPTSTETVMHTGMERAGWRGLLTAGVLFILPAALITLAFAWAYAAYGTTPTAGWLLYGIKPVVIAVVVQAIWGLGRTAFTGWRMPLLAAAVLALALAGVDELLLLLGAGVLMTIVADAPSLRRGAAALLPAAPLADPAWAIPLLAAVAEPYGPLRLFLGFLKIGATLYGSGYVLLAFVNDEFVDRLGWLSGQQLLDAVAVGQFTPGPVFTTATFVGYLVGGWGGAALATLAIFLPSFLLVGLTHRLIPKIRGNPVSAGFLDGVNAAAIALMAAVTLEIGRDALVDVPTTLLALGTAFLLIRFKINSAALIVGGAVAGLLLGLR